MEEAERKWVDSVANAVHKAYDIPSPVPDIRKTIRAMNGRLRTKTKMPDNCIVRNRENSFTLHIKYSAAFADKAVFREEAAKQLGYLFFTMYYQSDPEKWKQNPINTPVKKTYEDRAKAIHFARAFLMPEKEYKEFVKKNKYQKEGKTYINTKQMAEYFNVTELEAINRGIELKLFE